MALLAVGIAAGPAAHAGKGRNIALSISGTPSGSVTAGEAYLFQPSAYDRNGDRLTFSIVNRPHWLSFSSSTGRLSGTPALTHVGEYVEIRISVSDGRATRSLAPFSIVVREGNQAPRISGSPLTSAREGQFYEFRPVASDANGDPLTFSIANRPAWATFNSATGALTGTPGPGTAGTYANVTIRATDGTNSSSLPAFSIDVQQASMGSATLSWQAPVARTDGSSLSGLAGYRIHYGTASGSYPNVVQIGNAGVTTAVIENLPPGTYYFVATAYDTDGRESDFSGAVSKTIN